MTILAMIGQALGAGAGESIAKPIKEIGDVLDKLFTSDEERLSHAELMERIEQQLPNAQSDINKLEAVHSSLFVAGWRPAVGWLCAGLLGLYYGPQFVIADILWVKTCWATGVISHFPVGISDVTGLLFALLGFGSLRTYEKVKGFK